MISDHATGGDPQRSMDVKLCVYNSPHLTLPYLCGLIRGGRREDGRRKRGGRRGSEKDEEEDGEEAEAGQEEEDGKELGSIGPEEEMGGL